MIRFDEPDLDALDARKHQQCKQALEQLHVSLDTARPLVCVYCAPKVGSTSLISSLRLFGTFAMDVLHIHDDAMLRVLGNIRQVTVPDLLNHAATVLKKKVFVINIYRSPVERKMSVFFEKVGPYHFNVDREHIAHVSIPRAIRRFNCIFPHIGTEDHFAHHYHRFFPEWSEQEFQEKVLGTHFSSSPSQLFEHRNWTFINLRLLDVHRWADTLQPVLGIRLRIVSDNVTATKPAMGQWAEQFKAAYTLPLNLFESLQTDPLLSYYYSADERAAYLSQWEQRTGTCGITPFTSDEFVLYEEISLENARHDFVETHHYVDDGCRCKACTLKRQEVRKLVWEGKDALPVHHESTRAEYVQQRIRRVKQSVQSLRRSKHKTRTTHKLPF